MQVRVYIKFYLSGCQTDQVIDVARRIEGLHIADGETVEIGYDYKRSQSPHNSNFITISVPAERASELLADLVAEGYMD